MQKPGGAAARASRTGRSSGPRWTPAAPAAIATSSRSFTRTGTVSAPISARAAWSSSRGEASFERSCTEVTPRAPRRTLEQISTRQQPVVGHQHQAKERRYIPIHATNHTHRRREPDPDSTAVVNRRGADRWSHGHPWIYASDVLSSPGDTRAWPGGGRPRQIHRPGALLPALRDPASPAVAERTPGRYRLVARAIRRARSRRGGIDATAYRVVHAEGDGLPSLDRGPLRPLDRGPAVSAGLETMREDIVEALEDDLAPAGILLGTMSGSAATRDCRNGSSWCADRYREEIEVREGGRRYLAAPVDRPEDRRVPGPAPPPASRRRVARPGEGARLFRLPWLLCAAPRAPGRPRSWLSIAAPRRSTRGARNAALNGLGQHPLG